MRDPKRIYDFLFTLGEIWIANCPDMRFGQLMDIMELNYGCPFVWEDDDYLKNFAEQFDKRQEDGGNV